MNDNNGELLSAQESDNNYDSASDSEESSGEEEEDMEQLGYDTDFDKEGESDMDVEDKQEDSEHSNDMNESDPPGAVVHHSKNSKNKNNSRRQVKARGDRDKGSSLLLSPPAKATESKTPERLTNSW